MPEPKAGIRAVFMVSGKPDHRSVSVDDSLHSIVQVGPIINRHRAIFVKRLTNITHYFRV